VASCSVLDSKLVWKGTDTLFVSRRGRVLYAVWLKTAVYNLSRTRSSASLERQSSDRRSLKIRGHHVLLSLTVCGSAAIIGSVYNLAQETPWQNASERS
jgi:hypothetical protein